MARFVAALLRRSAAGRRRRSSTTTRKFLEPFRDDPRFAVELVEHPGSATSRRSSRCRRRRRLAVDRWR